MAGWRSLAAAIVFGVAVAACGQGGDGAGGGEGGDSAQSGGAEKQARVRCPPRVRTPARAANAPVDDVAGVRPGLTLDEASNVIQCEDRNLAVEFTAQGFRIETHGIEIRQSLEAKPAKPPMTAQEARDEYMAGLTNSRRDELEPGQQKFFVSAMGVPGEERVIGVWREQRFAEGRNPPIATVTGALTEKYGQPSNTLQDGRLVWLWDSMGRPIGRDSPIINQCYGIGPTSNYFNLSAECGLSIAAQVVPVRDNPALADSLQVGVADQAKGYQAIQDTEAALANLDAQRRAQELEKASKNADAPDL